MRKMAWCYFVALVVFIGGSALLYQLFWEGLSDSQKIDVLAAGLAATIVVVFILKIMSLVEWAEYETNRAADQRALQETREDLERLYRRIDQLEYPEEFASGLMEEVRLGDGISLELDSEQEVRPDRGISLEVDAEENREG